MSSLEGERDEPDERRFASTASKRPLSNAAIGATETDQLRTLTGLPPELMARIFHHVLVHDDAIPGLIMRWGPQFADVVPSPGLPSLAFVSQSIRAEALKVFLSRNTFSLCPINGYIETSMEHLVRWRAALGPQLVKHVRRIEFQVGYLHTHPVRANLPERHNFTCRFAVSLSSRRIAVTHTAKCGWPTAMTTEEEKALWRGTREYCVCDMVRDLGERVRDAEGYHGKVLLEFAQAMLDRERRHVEDVDCLDCGKVKLVETESE